MHSGRGMPDLCAIVPLGRHAWGMGRTHTPTVGRRTTETQDPSHRANLGADVVGPNQGVTVGKHSKCDDVIDFWIFKYESECDTVEALEAALRNRNAVIDELRAEVQRLSAQVSY